eukprot:CAMPEP_0185572970 /NCGR_PEP_ID=MMETSP0434-20130131/4808_1 /TAXON_ID=626734 ORGANISM="Favella taraikaensis, Strain Fe Narragansett Bay" /NCGR_SAMPLE_ID=MMETSP0434 /ASSEMBLY_ACC=CAM_ASM_000379 /LENGTH=114 /DNA_ID=CAMNT_0028189055 /DNA_START=252 /DNA_END=597 /DNA_ORIENTATION=+
MGTRETCLMSASEAQWESQWDEPVIERRAILSGSRSADEEQHRAAKIDLEGSLLSSNSDSTKSVRLNLGKVGRFGDDDDDDEDEDDEYGDEDADYYSETVPDNSSPQDRAAEQK